MLRDIIDKAGKLKAKKQAAKEAGKTRKAGKAAPAAKKKRAVRSGR
jgi:hypothetical protein